MELLNFNLLEGRPMKGGTCSFNTSIRNRSEAESVILVIMEMQFSYSVIIKVMTAILMRNTVEQLDVHCSYSYIQI